MIFVCEWMWSKFYEGGEMSAIQRRTSSKLMNIEIKFRQSHVLVWISLMFGGYFNNPAVRFMGNNFFLSCWFFEAEHDSFLF